MDVGKNIARYRKSKGLSQVELATKLNVSSSTVAMWETNKRAIKDDDLINIADFFNVSLDELVGRKDNWQLNKKDKRDIKNDLDNLLNNLDSNNALAFNGEPLDDETRELIAISIERSLRFAKEESKKKYTPKKYRNK